MPGSIHGEIGVVDDDFSLAFQPNDIDAVPGLVNDISAISRSMNTIDEETRLEMVAKTKLLLSSLESPREAMMRHLWGEPSLICALTACTEKGLWAHLSTRDGPFTAAKVADAIDIDPLLLSRFLRHICAMGYLKEVSGDTYELTNFIRSMATPFISGSYTFIAGVGLSALGKFHEWADKTGWKEPTDLYNAPLQHGHKTKLSFFEYVYSEAQYSQRFHEHMSGYRQGRPVWTDAGFFPVEQILVNGFMESPDATLLVDVGGSLGHDIEEFHKKYPTAPGRLILQDLPEVIEKITDLDESIERMGYDFYTEQPIKGARAYYLHSILHDWNDEACVEILSRLRDAMKPGYSKLLINEMVIPPTSAHWEATGLDILMLAFFSSKERTLENWDGLLQKADLKLVKVWSVPNGTSSLIECERV